MVQPKNTTQPKEKRISNFHEVSLGFSKKIAIEEALRCPQCLEPVCVTKGCPIEVNIPGFIRLLREGNVAGAYEVIRKQNPLPSICGRVCSAPCEPACILKEKDGAIGIRSLERYAADFGRPRTPTKKQNSNAKKIAIIGSGPTGLSAASKLAEQGYQVTIYESLDKPGGALRYGIPEFRIPRKILDMEIEEIKAQGVVIQTNTFIGQTLTLDDLKKQDFKVVLLAVGAGLPSFMILPGANLGGVYYGEEFLMRINQTKVSGSKDKLPFPFGDKIAVIGSGNTALDCARVAKRLGREVTLIFRRSEDEMRVREVEREYAKEEGIVFESKVKPLEIISNPNNFVAGIKCVRLDYADVKAEGKWELVPVPDSEFTIEADNVVIAIGHQPNTLINRFDQKIKLNEDGTIKIQPETSMTSIPGVFAAGNVVTNAGPIVQAIAAGKKVAEHIHQFISNN